MDSQRCLHCELFLKEKRERERQRTKEPKREREIETPHIACLFQCHFRDFFFFFLYKNQNSFSSLQQHPPCFSSTFRLFNSSVCCCRTALHKEGKQKPERFVLKFFSFFFSFLPYGELLGCAEARIAADLKASSTFVSDLAEVSRYGMSPCIEHHCSAVLELTCERKREKKKCRTHHIERRVHATRSKSTYCSFIGFVNLISEQHERKLAHFIRLDSSLQNKLVSPGVQVFKTFHIGYFFRRGKKKKKIRVKKKKK